MSQTHPTLSPEDIAYDVLGKGFLYEAMERNKRGYVYPFPCVQSAAAFLFIHVSQKRPGWQGLHLTPDHKGTGCYRVVPLKEWPKV